ncbi:MAG: nucleotidyltransferase domain-containing protein [Flavitalea sp.]
MSLENDILKVLAYFDIFHYPISSREIRSFLISNPSEHEVIVALQQLCTGKKIFKHEDFFVLRNDPTLVCQRKEDNYRAKQLLKTAYKISSFLFQFPYVRAIGISGSLSKNVADKNADIDFFVITKSNRLWVARTLMHLFKKLTFLVGRQHWFCMNYYIDEQALQISDKNIYTAIEVITLVPVCGNGALKSFFDANDWTDAYFPNYHFSTDSLQKAKHSFLKRSIESLFNNSFGEWLDNYLMKLTTRRWIEKEDAGKLNIKGGRMGLRTGKHFSKPNPAFFQQKILMLYESKLKEIDRITKTEMSNYSFLGK